MSTEKDELFTIDPLLYQFDDNRVNLLKSKEMTQLEFMRLIGLDDPWELHGRNLKVITKDEQIKRKIQYKKSYTDFLKNTGGLTGAIVKTHYELFVKIYPEIKEQFDTIKKEIEKDNCQGCTVNQKMQPVVEKILTLDPKERDLTSLSKLDPLIIKKLKGEEIEVKQDDIKLPPNIIKKDVPLLKDSKELLSSPTIIKSGDTQNCIMCARKHIAKAISLLNEYKTGKYPDSKWLAIGELSLAEDHVIVEHPNLAEQIRTERLFIMENEEFVPNLVKFFAIIDEADQQDNFKLAKVVQETPVVKKPQKHEKRKLILKNEQAPGDILMLTACVRDFVKAYGDDFLVDVRTPCDPIWENNPYLTELDEKDPSVEHIEMEYPIIHNSNEGAYHFIHGFRLWLEDKLDLKIPQGQFWGDIHFSKEELGWVSMIQEHHTKKDTPFWLMCAGGKTDYSAKWWIPEYAQAVVDHYKDKILFAQVGGSGEGHSHYPLMNVIDLVGKTDLRMLMRLAYHADGIICPITFLMHLAAALPQKPGKPIRKACVVTAGGREPSNFTCYTHHQYLHTNGCMKCCDNGGCWKSRISVIEDGDDHKNGELCEDTVELNGRMVQRCMAEGVTADDVIRAVEKYYINGNLEYLKK